MKIYNLVNAYVLPNLFYELMFLDEHGMDCSSQDWSDKKCVDEIIKEAVLTRFNEFTPETKTVVRNKMIPARYGTLFGKLVRHPFLLHMEYEASFNAITKFSSMEIHCR